MQKDIIKDLKIVAQEILDLEENADVKLMLEKSQEIYEKLVILNYLDTSVEEVPQEIHKKTEKVIISVEEEVSFKTEEDQIVENVSVSIEEKEEITIESFELSEPSDESEEASENAENEEETEPLDDIFVPTFQLVKEDFSLKEEFKHTVSLDDTENLFVTKKTESKQLSLNDRLLNSSIQVGLNDRIAFVNQLFNFSQSEFNNVLSVLNGFKTESEAKNYINITLKQKYGWKNKEEILERFLFLVERKFL
jgi:hypothetical protein